MTPDEQPTAAESEFYPTPAWVVHRLLDALTSLVLSRRRWIDPCVGDGALPDALDEHLSSSIDWQTWDIRDTGHAEHVGDWTSSPKPDQPADVCIMNPPFSKALQFADRAIRECGVVMMLQRIDWLASADRQTWLKANTPAMFVLPNRPDFSGAGGSGSEYAWMCWGLGHRDVAILDQTPLEVRRAQKPGKRAKAQMGLFS